MWVGCYIVMLDLLSFGLRLDLVLICFVLAFVFLGLVLFCFAGFSVVMLCCFVLSDCV